MEDVLSPYDRAYPADTKEAKKHIAVADMKQTAK